MQGTRFICGAFHLAQHSLSREGSQAREIPATPNAQCQSARGKSLMILAVRYEKKGDGGAFFPEQIRSH
jgi:hypothetical protein